MMHRKMNMNGLIPVSVGLLGLSGYEIILQLAHLPLLANDFVHGLWVGACIGVEILGVIILSKRVRRHTA